MKLTNFVNYLKGLFIMDLNFGKMFRDRRIAKGFTQEALATKLGVTKNLLSMVENGQRKLSEEEARKAAEILEVEDIETWIFFARKSQIIQDIQKQYPTQFNSLFRERKTKSNIYKNIVKASLDSTTKVNK